MKAAVKATTKTAAKQFGKNLAAKINQAPYNPRAMESLLASRYSASNVTSSTMPNIRGKNVKYANSRHERTGIVFNSRGMPIFDDVAKVEVRISRDLSHMRPEAHKVAATRQLSASCNGEAPNRYSGLYIFLDSCGIHHISGNFFS